MHVDFVHIIQRVRSQKLLKNKRYMTNSTINFGDIIKETTSRHWNVSDEFKDNALDTNIEICKNSTQGFSVGLINITGELNVGMIVRTASLMGAEAIHIFGRKVFDKRSTVGAENYIPIHYYSFSDPLHCEEETLNIINTLIYVPVLIEQGGVDINDSSFSWDSIVAPPEKPMFIFGSESYGIPQLIIDNIKDRVSIKQRGVLRSLNVSAAAAIVMADWSKFISQFS